MSYDDAFAALSDPSRRAIYERIAERPRSVGEIAAELPISQPAVSQHLRVLRGAGLVEVKKDGVRHIYHASPTGLAPLRTWLDSLRAARPTDPASTFSPSPVPPWSSGDATGDPGA